MAARGSVGMELGAGGSGSSSQGSGQGSGGGGNGGGGRRSTIEALARVPCISKLLLSICPVLQHRDV